MSTRIASRVSNGVSRTRNDNRTTHFLRIPLATAKSTPQLRESIGKAAKDPIVLRLPQTAWNTPDEWHISVGPLVLDNPDRIDRATQLVRTLDLGYITSTILALPETLAFDVEDPRLYCREKQRYKAIGGQVPKVALHGIFDQQNRYKEYPQATRAVTCHIREPKPFLLKFRWIIQRIFNRHGLMSSYSKWSDLSNIIMSLRYHRTTIPKDFPGAKHPGDTFSPLFNATDFHTKFQDFPWTTQFPLERLCISQQGLKDFVRNGEVIKTAFRNIVSVPLIENLPLTEDPADEDFELDPDEEYVKAAKTISKDLPVMPRIIPSTPPQSLL